MTPFPEARSWPRTDKPNSINEGTRKGNRDRPEVLGIDSANAPSHTALSLNWQLRENVHLSTDQNQVGLEPDIPPTTAEETVWKGGEKATAP